MKVLSLFDGISCARVALDRLGYKDVTYYASEVDKYAIQIAQKNWPQTKQVGDVSILRKGDFGIKDIDLLIGGSPCQDLSIAKNNRKGLDGARSGLFWEYVRILNEVKPKYFVLENVNSMPKEAKDLITKTLGVEPIMIDAALVSAQRRKRLFWTNIPGVTLPEDRGILLKDILEDVPFTEMPNPKSKRIAGWSDDGKTLRAYQPDKKKTTVAEHVYHHTDSQATSVTLAHVPKIINVPQSQRVYGIDGKSVTLSANGGGGGAKTRLYTTPQVRKLTCIECERLQGLDDQYTEGVSNTQRYKMLGNSFNCEVIVHLLLSPYLAV